MKKKFIGCIMFGLLMCMPPTTIFAGTWQQDKSRDWQYLKDNGKYAKNEWVYDNGSWYFFDFQYNMMHDQFVGSEIYNSGGDYYLDSSGKMASGGFITRPNDPYTMYFLDKDGHPVGGLLMVDGVLYEAESDGIISTYYLNDTDVLGIHNEEYNKYDGVLNNKYSDSYYIKAKYDHGKILDRDGKPFAADSRLFTQIKYLPKYDSKGNLIGAIQNPNGYVID